MRRIARGVIARLSRWFHGIEVTFLYRHDLAAIPEIPAPDGCEVTALDLAEAHVLSDAPAGGLETVRDRLSRGDQCYVVHLEGRIAHFSWVQTLGEHPISDAGIKLSIGDGDFWIYHCWTAEWCRGRRLYPLVLARILRDYKASGHSAGWIYTSISNAPSQRGILRAGFTQQRSLKSLILFGRAIPL